MARGPSGGNLYRVFPLVVACLCAPGLAAQSKSVSETVVSAFVWDAVNKPVAGVSVRLRNLDTGRVAGTMEADPDGHVTFRRMDRGTYVLEVADARGHVIATGQTFNLEIGESVATFVRLPARSPWYAGFFTANVGTIAVATAAAIGATAVGTTGQPQSPGR